MNYRSTIALVTLGVAGMMVGCSSTTKSPDVSDAIRKSLDQSGYKDVSVAQDRDKGVVKLTGHVPAESDKAQADQIATSLAAGQVVANEVMVLPVGAESAAKAINSDVDTAVAKLLDAVLIQNNLHDNVKYASKNGVVTLTREVSSQAIRTQAQQLAASIPNVQQVVNELQVKNQKATGSN